MFRIDVSSYEWRPRWGPLNARNLGALRQGALLRVEGGLADLHPWPELGDLPLSEQLSKLAKGEWTPLTRASVDFALQESEARAAGRSLFEGLEIPQSHVTWVGRALPSEAVVSQWLSEGYQFVKVKASPQQGREDLDRWMGLVQGTPLRLRVDANESLTEDLFASWLDHWDSQLEVFDFFEDPFLYDGARWAAFSAERGVRLAVDRALTRQECRADVLVVKPAWHGSGERLLKQAVQEIDRVIYTSSMDHPVGQLSAAWVAAKALHQHPLLIDACGLLTHSLFELNSFSEQLKVHQARLVPPTGSGWGWDPKLWEALPWTRLC